jgi:hypothetical protein
MRQKAQPTISGRQRQDGMVDVGGFQAFGLPCSSNAEGSIPNGFVHSFPDVNQVIGEQAPLEMSEILLHALRKDKKRVLMRQVDEFMETSFLLDDLFQQELLSDATRTNT